jgi:hypothetical protein
MTTTSAGVFNVPNLDLGTYRVRVSAKGFNTYDHPNLVLEANQVVNLDVRLSLGTASNVVEVQGTAPVITTETTDISSGVSHDSIEELPSVGRHAGDQAVYAFVTLTTGAASVPNSSTPIINGTRNQVGILPTMDGIAVMAFPQGAGPVQPSEEGIQKVKMETAVAPAEFSTPGNIAVVSKSGTNEYHGGALLGLQRQPQRFGSRAQLAATPRTSYPLSCTTRCASSSRPRSSSRRSRHRINCEGGRSQRISGLLGGPHHAGDRARHLLTL